MSPFRAALVAAMVGFLAACSTIQVTPHLPAVVWQTPVTPAQTAPETPTPMDPVEPVG